jgi:hypothetical protein
MAYEEFAKLIARDQVLMRPPRLVPTLLLAALLAALAAYVVPRGLAAGKALAIADDPVAITDRALDASFNAVVAQREIEKALAAGDTDLARSFVDLADARQIPLDPVLVDKVSAAVAHDASAVHTVKSFARGFVTGVPENGAALAGTAVGDLFVFGDIRDAVREGAHFVRGEPIDRVILGLACAGLAITAGTYLSDGIAAPARLGLTLAKAARKTGRLSAGLATSVGRMLRQVIDWGALKKALAGTSVAEPAAALRAARNAVKIKRAGGLLELAADVGRIERKAGIRAALDSLAIARTPGEVSRVAKLAGKEGGRTRAILKLLGRGAIMLTIGTFNLGVWILGALFTLISFVASLKSMTERATLRVLHHRKEQRRSRDLRRPIALTAAHA